MHLYIFRHGDRLHTAEDPKLSPVGEAQAQQLADLVENARLERPTQIWVSPKTRAQQTMSPVAKKLGLRLQIKSELDERTLRESQLQFRERVRHLLETAANQEGVIYLCSHMDWLEESLSIVPADQDLIMDGNPLWLAGSFVEFEIEKDQVWKTLRKGQLQW